MIYWKELTVVLAVAICVFALARPLCGRFIALDTFDRRRNVWLLLTAVALLSPSYWGYVLVAVPVLYWLGQRDENPPALFVFFFYLVPPYSVEIPVIGINRLFDLNQLRILSLAILLPAAFKQTTGALAAQRKRLTGAEYCLLAFIGLQIVLLIPLEDFTNTMRRALLMFLDSFLVLYCMSRASGGRKGAVDAMLMLCLSGAIMAPLAVFEAARSWLLYAQLSDKWGTTTDAYVFFRDGVLRAQVSTGHALTLGYMLAMGLCFWLFIGRQLHSTWLFMLGAAWIVIGLIAANSRGPWVTAALAVVLYLALASKSVSQLGRRLGMLVLIGSAVLLSPVGDAVISKLPFVGDDPGGSVAYRARLAELSWELVWQHPWFGDPFVMRNMEEMRQGQGIIDFVNAYANVALFNGFVGLFLYTGTFAVILWGAASKLRLVRADGSGEPELGIVLIAACVATLVFMATGGLNIFQYVVAGLLGSWVGVAVDHPSSEPRGQDAGKLIIAQRRNGRRAHR